MVLFANGFVFSKSAWQNDGAALNEKRVHMHLPALLIATLVLSISINYGKLLFGLQMQGTKALSNPSQQ